MFSMDWLSRAMAFDTPPTARFWMCGVLQPRMADDLVGLALDLERLQIVRDRQQVHLRRQLHRRMAPVAVGEDAELARRRRSLELLLDGPISRPSCAARRRGSRQRRGLGRVGLERGDHVDPVERRQVVEVDDVVVHRVRGDDHVADVLGVHRHLEPSAFSTARTEAIACTVVHTPQKRWVMIQASRGSRPMRISSMPRHICPDDQALVTLPPSPRRRSGGGPRCG